MLHERQVPLGLVTGKGHATTVLSLRHFGLEDVFDVVECGSAAGVVKTAAIRQIVARWSVSPSSVIYVGDAVFDIEAAREAAVIPVAAAWASTSARTDLEAAQPALIFSDADVFCQWLVTASASR
jgi:phosphoglycolate phosphatase-like HAD superfamily hydrolase